MDRPFPEMAVIADGEECDGDALDSDGCTWPALPAPDSSEVP